MVATVSENGEAGEDDKRDDHGQHDLRQIPPENRCRASPARGWVRATTSPLARPESRAGKFVATWRRRWIRRLDLTAAEQRRSGCLPAPIDRGSERQDDRQRNQGRSQRLGVRRRSGMQS